MSQPSSSLPMTGMPNSNHYATAYPNHSVETLPSQTSTAKPPNSAKGSRGRRERPCDACRRRKSKCVMNEGTGICAACAMHNQKCTFVEDPRPRKRRVDDGSTEEGAKKRATAPNTSSKKSGDNVRIKREESETSHVTSSSSATSAGNWQYHGSHIGYTTELEPMLFDISSSGGPQPWGNNYQKSDDRNAFLTFDGDEMSDPRTASMHAVEKVAGSQGPSLLRHFQRSISRSFPIVEDASFSPSNRRNMDPALLCAICTVSASSPGYQPDSSKKQVLDIAQLEDLALNLIRESLFKPTLSTIQAGLLLMQRSDVDSKSLNTQLVGTAFELGLHLDCTSWTISDEERGLRKRLAWAVYMQDQWCSLVHGRPSLISKAHWAVQPLYDEDFGLLQESRETSDTTDERERGQECFCEMVALTELLSSILDTFYTQRAVQEYDNAKENGTRLILERAKPIQMKLKEWFTKLSKSLKLDSNQAPSMIGHLHLAYFATEITLHRCIIRSLAATSTDTYLTHICRSAAKTRLISAMDFVNRLRPDHLTSFWYFPSKVNFALVATFGSLLLATAPCQEEADFYRARLGEYRWTLSVSAKNAGFLNFAIESLESSADLLRSLPEKPKIEDLDVRQLPALPSTIIPLAPQPGEEEEEDEGEEEEEEEEDEVMPDVPPIPPQFLEDYRHAPPTDPEESHYGIAIPLASDGMNFMGGSNTFNFTGPFAGTAFAGLAAPDWFDASHHGSPEAERMVLTG